MDFLTNLLENSSMPWVTAILLGFMTSISPCPLFIQNDILLIQFMNEDSLIKIVRRASRVPADDQMNKYYD